MSTDSFKSRFQRLGIRRRFLLTISLVIILLGLLIALLVNKMLSNYTYQAFEHHNLSMTKNLSADSVDPILTQNMLRLQNYIDNIKQSEEDIAYIYIISLKGKVLTHTFEDGFPAALKGINTPVFGQSYSSKLLDTEAGYIRDFAVPIFGKLGTTHIGISETRIRKYISQTMLTIIFLTALFLVFGILLINVIIANVLSPIKKLSNGVEAIGMGNYDYRVKIKTNDELELLAATFNDMAYKLQTNVASLEHEIMEHKRTASALKESEDRYRSVVDNIAIGVSVISPDMRILSLNAMMQKWFPEIEVLKSPLCYKAFNNPPSDDICSYCPTVKTLRDGKVHESVTATPAGDEIRAYRVISSPLYDKDGRIIAAIELVDDITDRRKAETALRQSEEKYRSLVDFTTDSIYLVDKNYKYLFINKQHLLRLGLTEEQYINQTYYRDFHSPQETELFIQKADEVFKSGMSSQYEYKSFRDGRYFLQTISPVKDVNNRTTAVTVISKDIDILKQTEEKLYSISMTDELTGLYNRRGFLALSDQQLKVAHRENRKMFLMSADLDFLKFINDMAGHHKGDTALINVAKMLKQTFRESDIIARIGGDEFVVLGSDTPETNFEILSERLRQNLKTYNDKVNEPFGELSLSYGFTVYDPKNHRSIEDLLSEADKLMYQHKREKK
jgi:diguanylate cyclase (GGDEF)-like protein/PAS domain S-box-containing protein